VPRGYGGRSHSLWFADASSQGRYGWFETAFTGRPNGSADGVIPFALTPGPEAADALGPTIASHQVAWPFTELILDHLSEFLDRWAGWLAEAASQTLKRPTELPERNPDGSWRR
jgi:eukaryotic-like serine/threonine-protein kinase